MARQRGTNGGRAGWGALLARRINVTSLPEQLITLADARAMIVEHVPAEKQRCKQWQSAGLKLMAAAQDGRPDLIEAATKQMEVALLLDGRLRMRR
jgi:hypothetical protein